MALAKEFGASAVLTLWYQQVASNSNQGDWQQCVFHRYPWRHLDITPNSILCHECRVTQR